MYNHFHSKRRHWGFKMRGKRKKGGGGSTCMHNYGTCAVFMNTCTYLTQCNELPMGEFASCVAIEIAMNIHKLLSADWLLADTKYATNFLMYNHKYVNARVSHCALHSICMLNVMARGQHINEELTPRCRDVSIADSHLVFHERAKLWIAVEYLTPHQET